MLTKSRLIVKLKMQVKVQVYYHITHVDVTNVTKSNRSTLLPQRPRTTPVVINRDLFKLMFPSLYKNIKGSLKKC